MNYFLIQGKIFLKNSVAGGGAVVGWVVEFYSGRDLLTGSFTAFYRGLYPALSIIKIIICQIILN